MGEIIIKGCKTNKKVCSSARITTLQLFLTYLPLPNFHVWIRTLKPFETEV